MRGIQYRKWVEGSGVEDCFKLLLVPEYRLTRSNTNNSVSSSKHKYVTRMLVLWKQTKRSLTKPLSSLETVMVITNKNSYVLLQQLGTK